MVLPASAVSELDEATRSMLFNPEAAAEAAAARVEPFRAISQPELWTTAVVEAEAMQQRRILQILADVAIERGLTKAEARTVYEEKWGEIGRSSFYYAFNSVAELDLVVRGSGGAAHFTLDPVALKVLRAP